MASQRLTLDHPLMDTPMITRLSPLQRTQPSGQARASLDLEDLERVVIPLPLPLPEDFGMEDLNL